MAPTAQPIHRRAQTRPRIPVAACATLLLSLLACALGAQTPAPHGRSEHRGRGAGDEARDDARVAVTDGSGPDEPGEMDALTRELWRFAKHTSYEAALRHARDAQARRQADAPEMPLPTGWRLAPAGRQVDVGRLPYEAALSGGNVVVLNTGWYPAGAESPEITLVDPRTTRVLKTTFVASLYPSAAPGDDRSVYVSGGSSDSVFQLDSALAAARGFPVGGYAGPIARLDSGHLAVALLTAPDSSGESGPGKLLVLDTRTGATTGEIATGYFPSAMVAAAGKLYVALVGEHRVQVYDVRTGVPHPLRTIASGRAPQSLCADDGHVYVVNSASDEVVAIATSTDAIVARYAVRFPGPRGRAVKYGSAPTSCAASGGRLYVSAAGMNAVAVFGHAGSGNASSGVEPVGLIPTGWYPTRVLATPAGLAILSAKGIRPQRPNPDGPQPVAAARHSGPDYILSLLKGSLAIVPESTIAPQLATWTQQVAAGAPLYSAADGLRLPIRHVFYVVRENRSYDQVLGDLGRGDGDSSLTLFGEKVTPVAHQLAREFVTLDHFYADGEISVLGHSYTTSGYASPFLEWLGNTAYASRYRGYPFGTVPAVYSPAYLWDALEAKGVSYRIYGEPYYLFTRLYRLITDRYGADSPLARRFYAHSMSLADSVDRGMRFTELGTPVTGQSATPAGAPRLLRDTAFANGISRLFTGDASLAQAIGRDSVFRRGVATWLTHYMLGYPTWNLLFSDLDRVALWKRDFQAALRTDQVPAFSYLWLPNDHTAGVNPHFPNPFQLVAQNDAALGQLVETISRSPIWRESVIIVEEDDAQNGPDHIDGTRTVGLLAGPWVKRGAVVSDRYDQLSALRTVELLLGLDPLNLGDALAVPMFGAFTTHMDGRGFRAPGGSGYLREEDQAKLGGR